MAWIGEEGFKMKAKTTQKNYLDGKKGRGKLQTNERRKGLPERMSALAENTYGKQKITTSPKQPKNRLNP